jgi:plastocyanin
MHSPRACVPAFVATFGLAIALVGAACNSNSSPAGATSGAGGGAGSSAAGSSAAGSSAATGGNSVAIVDFAFNPTSVTVKAGTTVNWMNNGSTTHTVTADDGSFDSGNLNGGASFSHTFASAGTFSYHCSIHSSMKATVTVTP